MNDYENFIEVVKVLAKHGCYRFVCPWCGEFFDWKWYWEDFRYPYEAKGKVETHDVRRCYSLKADFPDGQSGPARTCIHAPVP